MQLSRDFFVAADSLGRNAQRFRDSLLEFPDFEVRNRRVLNRLGP
jgi:hypothetical protein